MIDYFAYCFSNVIMGVIFLMLIIVLAPVVVTYKVLDWAFIKVMEGEKP